MHKLLETKEEGLLLLGKAIRSARRDLKLSQEGLAEKCELHPTYISRVESGRKNISFENIQKISYALKLKPSWLLDRAGL